MASLSRQLAQWVVGLRYEDLPAEVVDRVKGVTLHNISSALLGARTKSGEQAVTLVTEDEAGVKKGATIMVFGGKVTNAGAAFANSELTFAGGKWDTFRMLTHPGTSIIPGALVAAETSGSSGRDFVVAVAAGYEVMERLASEYIPSLMARGFHPSPVFGIFGPAIAAAKLFGLNEDQMNSTIALAASLASGNIEGARSGGKALRAWSPQAVAADDPPESARADEAREDHSFECDARACRDLDKQPRADELVKLTLQ